MGVWGSGNFDDDTAWDHRESLRETFGITRMCAALLEAIEEAMKHPGNLEPDEYDSVAVMCNLEIVARMMDLFGEKVCKLPKPKVIEQWKKTYLRVWDGYVEELGPKPDWKRDRREVIVRTFDRALELAGEQHDA